jgi:hypothetical protein
MGNGILKDITKDGQGEALTETIDPSILTVKENNPLKDLLPRQRKFLKKFIETKNRVIAWKATHKGCTSDTAAFVGVNIFLKKHPAVVEWLYDAAGIGDDALIKVARESMEATKTQFYLGKSYPEPDHYARMKSAELALKLRGKDGTKVGNQMNIQIINDSTKGVVEIINGEE